MDREQHINDLLPGYALGILDEDERRQVMAHLQACSVCQAELLDYQVVSEQLPLIVPQREPPTRLRRAILNAVTGESPRTASWWSRLKSRLVAPMPAWGLVGVTVLLILLLLGGVSLWQQNQRLLQAQHTEFAVASLKGTAYASQANGWVVISKDGVSGTLIVQGLPTLPAGHEYQLWLIKDNQRTSGGLFTVDEKGYASVWVYSYAPLSTFQRFGITIEPAGGSLAPTGEKVLGN